MPIAKYDDLACLYCWQLLVIGIIYNGSYWAKSTCFGVETKRLFIHTCDIVNKLICFFYYDIIFIFWESFWLKFWRDSLYSVSDYFWIGIKICRWALVQIYSRDVGVCCQSWGGQGRIFATNTLGEAINLHQCSVADLNGYDSAFEW